MPPEISVITLATDSVPNWLGDQQDPWCSDYQKYCKEEERYEQAKPIELPLCEIAAAYEDDVLAATLGGYDREVTARKKQSKRHQRCGNASSDADIDENPEQSQHLRRLADKHVVNQHIQQDQYDVGYWP